MDQDTGDDRTKLRELVEAYASAADRRDDDAFVGLFTDDATLTIGQEGGTAATFARPDGLRAADVAARRLPGDNALRRQPLLHS